MGAVTENLGLTTWDLNDLYSHAQLAANFNALDIHDHTGTPKGKPIPYGGLDASSVGTSQLRDGAVTTSKIGDATVSAAKLVSPTHSSYRNILTAGGIFTDASTTATYLFYYTGALSSTTYPISAPVSIYYDDADYTVSGLTPKFRLRAQCYVNGFAPTRNFSVKLYPISSVAGTADTITYTLGAALTDVVTFSTPGLSSKNTGVTADFDISSDGHYALGCTVSGGTVAADSVVSVAAQLQMHYV